MAVRVCHSYGKLLVAVTIIGMCFYYVGVWNIGLWNNGTVRYRTMRPPIFHHQNQTEPSGHSLNSENLRRRILDSVVELGNFFNGQLLKIQKLDTNYDAILEIVNQTLEDGGHQQRSVIADIEDFSRLDGGIWRANEAKELSSLVQRRLSYLQNPTDCNAAKKIVCYMQTSCGFGCQVHHVTDCMIAAYATQRTLILESKGWTYGKKGWETYFMPLSETCVSPQGKTNASWKDAWPNQEDVQVIDLLDKPYFSPRPDYLSLVIPEDISERLMRFHGRPYVWWVGQVVAYVTRLNSTMTKEIEAVGKEMGFQHPIVGIHIRRGDVTMKKQRTLYELEDYMVHVEEFYQILERIQTVDKRRVFLATDENTILVQAQEEYPQYVFVANKWPTQKIPRRYSKYGLQSILEDVYFLAHSDFLVCTFTSNVGKLAFELMQAVNPDASAKFRSLDAEYWYTHRHKEALYTALVSHEPRIRKDEIALSPGDKVDQLYHHSDGYSYGRNIKSGAKGRFPTYKVRESFKTVKMPTYPEVPLKVTFGNGTV